ncbi:MAG: methionine synthase [Actinomycetes bacterium]
MSDEERPTPPWPPGSATGVGSLPGTDIDEAVRLVLGELPDFPHLPELPQRGPGADMIGRAAALLTDLHVDLQPSGWRLTDRAGMDERRARDFLARDLDALEEHAADYAGALKVQVVGPWTLSASLERSRGDRALADHGARRDLAESLADGLTEHVTEIGKRVPRARICVQLDEPSTPAVLSGMVPSAVGYRTVAAVEASVVADVLRVVVDSVVAAHATPLIHCCASRPPIDVFRAAGARAVSVDGAQLDPSDDDMIGAAVEGNTCLLVGLLPSTGPGVPPVVRDIVAPARGLWRRLGFSPERLAHVVVVTPACGLADASEGWVRTAMRLARQAGRVLLEAPEEPR